MSSYLSNLTIVGNLGRDPDMRYTPAGKAVTNFSVAVNRQYSNASGQPVKETVWFKVTAWDKQGEVCNQYLKKGAKVLVEGRLVYDPQTGGPKTWEGQDGAFHADFELVAQTVRFLSAKDGNGNGHSAETSPSGNDEENDIPF